MKVSDLIEVLKNYNPEAEVDVIARNRSQEFSICFGGYDGCTKANAESVSFYVDSLCDSEQE